MHPDLLRSFVVLAEQQHFGRAAKVLCVSQPALSKRLRQLEEEIGAPLLDRGRHGAALTPLGTWLLAKARSFLQHAEELLVQAKRAARGETGRLSVGFGISTLQLVPRVVARFRARFPDVEVRLQDMATADQLKALRQRRLDVGLVRLPVAADLEALPVLRERIAIALSSADNSPGRTSTLSTFAVQPFVMLSRDRSPGFYDHALRLCAAAGFRPRIVQEAHELSTALAMVAAGCGVALVPSSAARLRVLGVSCHPLSSRSARWTVGLAWLRNRPDPIREAFTALLLKEAKQLRG